MNSESSKDPLASLGPTPCGKFQRPTYEVAEDGQSITFMPCGIKSNHRPGEERYCYYCNRKIKKKQPA
jgi:hypothetical protein